MQNREEWEGNLEITSHPVYQKKWVRVRSTTPKKWVELWLAAVSPCRAPIGRLYVCYISQLLGDSFSVSQQPPICEFPSHSSLLQLDIIIHNSNWIVMSFPAKFKRKKRYKFGECCLHLLFSYDFHSVSCQLFIWISYQGGVYWFLRLLKNEKSEYIYLFPILSKCIYYVN